MGRKKSPGLYKRGEVWHIDKRVFGQRLCESTGVSSLTDAESFLARRVEQLRQAVVFGVRPKRTFRQAATKYIFDNQTKATIKNEAYAIKMLDKYIGNLPLEAVHMGALQTYIEDRQRDGVKNRTINLGLQVARQILNLAANAWLDENGMSWLIQAPKIKLLSEADKRKPYPLSWEEQTRLFRELPAHLSRMALFAANTGCRDREICRLRWDWEMKATNADHTTVFVIPSEFVKNRDDRLVVLNSVAQSVIDEVRGQHAEYVFTYKGKPIDRMLNSAWQKARIRAGLAEVRVHDLKHTFGRRLRAAGVGFEDRQDLLGHRSGRITTHYSAAELQNLIDAANKACDGRNTPTLAMIKCNDSASFRKSPARTLEEVKKADVSA